MSSSLAWRDRAVLVTGASGLLGGHVCELLLAHGAEVTALVRDRNGQSRFWQEGVAARCRLAFGDVTDGSLLQRILGERETTVVVHLAAQTLVQVAARNPASTWATNLGGTAAVLEACRTRPRIEAVVVASSDKVYGRQDAVLTEDAPLLASAPYGASKVATELLVRSYAATWGLPAAMTRCANFFGPGDLNWSRLVPGTARAALRGEQPVLRSDGTAVRDWLYVRDGAAGTLAIAEALLARPELRGRAWNLSMEQPRTVHAVAQALLDVLGRPDALTILGQAKDELPHQALSCARARADLGFAAPTSWEAALAETAAWYEHTLGRTDAL
jgi:CDP-glucose 4,6-dehydratase